MGTTILAQEGPIAMEGVFKFDTETINYGNVKQNSDGNRIFSFKNVGHSAIIITSVHTSCGCTIVTKPSKPILPGEIGEIGVAYATNRKGAFSKTITITSNATDKNKILRIKGKVMNSNAEEITSTN